MNPTLSIVLPAYNPGGVFVDGLTVFLDRLRNRIPNLEVLIIDDGSTDGSLADTASIHRRAPEARVIHLPLNLGKGAAVRRGMLEARGQYRAFMDADFPYDPEAIPRMLVHLERGADVVIGDRTLPGSRSEHPVPMIRNFAGRLLSRLLAWTLFRSRSLPDTQCGCKAFRGDVADRLFGALRTRGFGFDIEILSRAARAGLRIDRVPVHLIQNGRSSVRIVRDSITILSTVLRLVRFEEPPSGAMASGPCPVCGDRNASMHARFQRWVVVDCRTCGLRYLDPQPTAEELEALYRSSYYDNEQPTESGYHGYGDQGALYVATFRRRLDALPPSARRGRLLDLGCGYGYYLEAARGKFAEYWGCDLSSHALTVITEKGFRALPGPIESQTSVPNGTFHLVTMDDFIEHLPNPIPVLEAVARIVEPGGFISIATPNTASLLARVSGRRWVSYKIPEHVVYFRPSTLRAVLERIGFRVRSIRPTGQMVTVDFLADRVGKLLTPLGWALRHLPNRLRSLQLYVPSGSMLVIAERIRDRA